MRRDKLDGRPTGDKGVITKEQQLAALGIDQNAPKPAPLPLTPAQARRQMSGEWIGDDLTPPDFERSVVSDPETVAQAMGARPEDFDAVPLGSAPEGMPIPQPGIRPKIKPRPERATVTAEPSRPLTPEAADELRTAYHRHRARVTAMAESAKQSGDTASEARAAAEVRASAEVGERLKAKLANAGIEL